MFVRTPSFPPASAFWNGAEGSALLRLSSWKAAWGELQGQRIKGGGRSGKQLQDALLNALIKRPEAKDSLPN